MSSGWVDLAEGDVRQLLVFRNGGLVQVALFDDGSEGEPIVQVQLRFAEVGELVRLLREVRDA